MEKKIRIELQPLGVSFKVEKGTDLQDVLFEYGVEFPCGGQGRCKGCRVRVLQGHLEVTEEQAGILTEKEVAEGWRLSCRCAAEDDVVLELAQWEASILEDNSVFTFTPSQGFGIAVDLGTTTVVAQLVDLSNGQVVGVKSALNPQARHGGDIMSRIHYALVQQGAQELTQLIRKQILKLVHDLLHHQKNPVSEISTIMIVGNTAMHHFFCDLDISPLSYYPFETEKDGLVILKSEDLGWDIPGKPEVHFLPCLGSFVGSDILAGVLATQMDESDDLVGLVDLGTNGEIVFGNRNGLICASTAAGPAFEGAKISTGMRASTGAIYQVFHKNGVIEPHVIGKVAPRGICGSGLVDAVAVGLELNWINSTGRITQSGGHLTIADKVTLNQQDIRQLQLAKGAIAAGIHILLDQIGAAAEDVKCLYLAGAFGNYIRLESALRIGLFPFPLERIKPVGNSALRGTKMALFDHQNESARALRIRDLTRHFSLSTDPKFQDTFVEEMMFNHQEVLKG